MSDFSKAIQFTCTSGLDTKFPNSLRHHFHYKTSSLPLPTQYLRWWSLITVCKGLTEIGNDQSWMYQVRPDFQEEGNLVLALKTKASQHWINGESSSVETKSLRLEIGAVVGVGMGCADAAKLNTRSQLRTGSNIPRGRGRKEQRWKTIYGC